ncbi:MarR family winged helix-turn-helix transcriptional regulator [Furfurilactobacillus siliginis]|uniref:MarR family transcriptional regulator n=1 Tax=Furfurilactobacillus siliginis TaxID=348151 RepID=A0A0R2L3Z8_9LACO|nr:MarR family winged helix-turn-helix transcriptional regulator [Furfurilactobacillus siliginis]KRN96128.1 hypothetical protein IV55_GL001511 [Furfurilactobacillus siliginis]GEK27948.1 MarR family transcriptional regulator [Furfurilactobacillus siliginis]
MNRFGSDISELLRQITHKQMRTETELMQQTGLNQQQGRTLEYIGAHEGIIQKALADAFRLRGATITSMLQGLESNGYIERRTQADNARQKQIYLLPKGRAVLEQISRAFETSNDTLVKALSPVESEQLIKLLAKINRGLDPE